MILSNIWSIFTGPTKRNKRVDFYEMILVCWIFYIIGSTYTVIFHNFSLTFKQFSFWPRSSSLFESTAFLYWTLVLSIFYPLYLLVIKEVWVFIIKFFNIIFSKNSDPELAEDIIITSFSGHILLALPLIGSFFHQLIHLVYLYLGLRKKMLMSRLQSLVIIISPLLFIAIIGFFLLLTFMVFISILGY
ncbi:MAG: hypothetical protein ACO20H_04200 [Bacteriovoracaceae bacterium]